MIIKKDKTFETNSQYPDTNWYKDEDNYIIDETTEEGKVLAKIYIDNFPFVELKLKVDEVIGVKVLETEKAEHDKQLEIENSNKELEQETKPSEDEVKKAERELQMIILLQELGVI